jgi:hypothetical protein
MAKLVETDERATFARQMEELDISGPASYMNEKCYIVLLSSFWVSDH